MVSSTRKLSILAQCADASVVSIYTHGPQSPRVHETAAIQESVLFGSKTCVERSHSIFGTNRHKNRRTTDWNSTSADGMYLQIELVCTATTHIQQSNMDQPRKVAKPARGQLHKEVKYPCTVRRCIRGKYIQDCCLYLFIYQVQFY